MNSAEFGNCMSDLRDYYGGKAYPPKTESVIWRIVSGISKGELEQVISSLVEEHKLPPTPGQIKKAALPFIRRTEETRRKEAVAQISQGERCKICGDSGFLLALKKSEPDYEFSFACPYCRAADVSGYRNIPQWREELRAEFIPVSLKADSHNAAKELQGRYRETQVCRSWEERLKTQPYTLRGFANLGGTVPGYLKKFLEDNGLGHLVPRNEPDELGLDDVEF